MQVLLVYAIQSVFLICLLFGLHWFSPKIGLLPVLFVMLAINILIALSPFINTVLIFPTQLRLSIVSHTLVPLFILNFLIIYILHNETIAQVSLFSFVVVNILIVLMMMINLYFAHVDPQTIGIISTLEGFRFSLIEYLRDAIASILGFSFAMVSSVIVYQSLQNLLRKVPYIIIIFVSITVALWVDSIIFVTLSSLGLGVFRENLSNDISIKTVIPLILIIPTYIYFQALKKYRFIGGSAGRPILGIVFGSQAQLVNGFVEMQSELYFNQQIYEHLTENLDEIIYIIDIASENLIYVSPAFEAITGFEDDILNNKVDNLQLVLHPDDRVEPPLLDFMLSENPVTFRFIHKNGNTGWMSNCLLPIHNKQGVVYRYMGIATNITQSYERQKRELDLKVSQERIRILQNFVRDASHDLKTPLNSILLKIDMMKHAPPARQATLQTELKDRAFYISKMIDDLFTLSLIEGNDPVAYMPTDLQMVAQTVLMDLDALAQAKSITMTLIDTDADCTIMSTQDVMTRVFTNLVSNAIRYSKKGQITITFSANDEVVSFSVSDTGIGIPEDHLDKVFNRFFRSDNAREFSSEGTGLGLAIIQAIIEKHNGTISATSRINHGTTFHVTLPRK